MVFASKPKKSHSKLVKDKRKISLLNCDFKIITGIEASRHSKIINRTVSENQFAVGKNKKIHHAINLARDAIFAAGKEKKGCGIVDLDFQAAFDFLCMEWVQKVLKKKGLSKQNLSKIKRIYEGGITIPLINNIAGRKIKNLRGTLRQGYCPSSNWFCYGIDPLIIYLQKRLSGIKIYNCPILGPAPKGHPPILPPKTQKYSIVGYCDDIKPAINNWEELLMVDKAVTFFENSSGCKLHRDPKTEKCKILLLGKWIGIVKQNDIPLNFLKISDHMDMLGVKLYAKYVTTRQQNGEDLIKIVKNKIDLWKTGKFVPLTSRPWSLNTYILSKIWYRTSSIDSKEGDCKRILSLCKSWLYQNNLVKPTEILIFRNILEGGLGMFNISAKAKANLIVSFLQTAVEGDYTTFPYHAALFEYFVEKKKTKSIINPPYYSQSFFQTISSAIEEDSSAIHWKTKDWYTHLIKKNYTHYWDPMEQKMMLIPSRIEIIYPQFDHNFAAAFIRQPNLTPRIRSYLFMMKNDLLPTKERLFRLKKVNNSNCDICNCQDGHGHFLICPGLTSVTYQIISVIRKCSPAVSVENIVNCDVKCEGLSSFCIAWLLGSMTSFIWENKLQILTKIDLYQYKLKSELKTLALIPSLQDKYLISIYGQI